MQSDEKKPFLGIIIVDGLGSRQGGTAASNPRLNPWNYAKTPNLTRYLDNNPKSWIGTAGHDVGLPDDKTSGNSEVGHNNAGSGRIPKQAANLIDEAITAGTFAENPALQELIAKTKLEASVLGIEPTVHIAGLCSGGIQGKIDEARIDHQTGNTHASMDHQILLAIICARAGLKVKLHIITDGRDNGLPGAGKAIDAIGILENCLEGQDIEIVSISGRYYAMDRDNKFQDIEPAYHAIKGDSQAARIEKLENESSYAMAKRAIQAAYDNGQNDENLMPVALGSHQILNGQSWIFFNFRPDRAVEINTVLLNPDAVYLPHDPGGTAPVVKNMFDTGAPIQFAAAMAMAPYSYALTGSLGDGIVTSKDSAGNIVETPSLMTIMYPPERLYNTLPSWLSKYGIKQYACAETEKYSHITRFFAGGVGTPADGETWEIIPSGTDYNRFPAMKAVEVTDAFIKAIVGGVYNVGRINLANPDMVGHTVKVPDDVIKALNALDTMEGFDRKTFANIMMSAIMATDDEKIPQPIPDVLEKLANDENYTPTEHELQELANTVAEIGLNYIRPSIIALETIDEQLGRIETALKENGGIAYVGADHGNIEDATSSSHTTGAVEWWLMGDEAIVNNYPQQLINGRLSDIAPTFLQLMRDVGYQIETPPEMTGSILAVSNSNFMNAHAYHGSIIAQAS